MGRQEGHGVLGRTVKKRMGEQERKGQEWVLVDRTRKERAEVGS